MRKRRHRILAGVGWVVGSVIAWVFVCNVVAIVASYFMRFRGGTGDFFDDVYLLTAFTGFVIVPAFVALLALRAKLPWTGDGLIVRVGGFPVVISRQRDREG